MNEFEERRKTVAKRRIGQAVADHLEMAPGAIAEMVDGCPDQVREALAEALGRSHMIQRLQERQAAEEEEPGRCENSVCREWIGSEGETVDPETGVITFTGRQNFCSKGGAFACGCLYRMRESPPNHLDGVACEPIPEWGEAIRMLRRAELLEPDDFGKSTGTDFTLDQNTRRLWWAVVDLLVETGRIEERWVEEAEMRDRGEEAARAKALLFPEAGHALEEEPVQEHS